MNPPSSSHFVAKIMPVPSKTKIFKRSALRAEDENIAAIGIALNASATNATRPCTPFRKSTGCVGDKNARFRAKRDHGVPRSADITSRASAIRAPGNPERRAAKLNLYGARRAACDLARQNISFRRPASRSLSI